VNNLEDMVDQRTAQLTEANSKLQNALSEIRTLQGILPVCSFCKNIRDDKGYWSKIEAYISSRTDAEFSHSICPDCMKKYYPEQHRSLAEKNKLPEAPPDAEKKI